MSEQNLSVVSAVPQIERATKPPESLPTLVDAETLAKALGVGVRQIRRLVDERRIPFVKVGRFVRFDVEQITGWVDANRVEQYRPARARTPIR